MFQLLAEGCGGDSMALGGQHETLAPTGDGRANALLAGAITVGGIKESNAQIEASLDNCDCLLLI
jgi:hypothetical protein